MKSHLRRATLHGYKNAKIMIIIMNTLMTSQEPLLVNYSFVGASRRQQEVGL